MLSHLNRSLVSCVTFVTYLAELHIFVRLHCNLRTVNMTES